jgi:hypothetical protein
MIRKETCKLIPYLQEYFAMWWEVYKASKPATRGRFVDMSGIYIVAAGRVSRATVLSALWLLEHAARQTKIFVDSSMVSLIS